MPTILKLGGSVITDKERAETLDGPALDAAADAVATADDDLVLVHGGGSFGHHHAEEHGVSTTSGTHDPDAVLAVHGAMKTLNQFVVSRLRERDVPAVPVHPLSLCARDEDADLDVPLSSTATLVDEGFVPVLHGDVVAHAGKGATVVSGDELVVELAEGLDADRVGLCSTVPGVLDEDDAVISEITDLESVAAALGEADSTDVTGGMAAKVRALLELSSPAHVFGPDDLAAFLAGDEPGTRIG
jgi:isopentenyl phosphate kinase